MLYGRDDEIHTAAALFDGGARLVTLHGPPGIGKTALARAVAARIGTATFCDLTEARSVGDVCMVVAGALDVSLGGGRDPVAMLATMLTGAIAAHGAPLVVLDNVEQLAEDVARIVSGLLAACPTARILVTSRETLRVPEEHVVEVGSLAPESGVMLLVAAAQRSHHGRRLDGAEGVLAEIVRRLEGVPLALELAGSRLGVMEPAELLTRIGTALDVVSAQWRARPGRQRSLQGAFEWSWSLLDATERSALVQCTVFRGGFFLVAAEAVVRVGGGAELEAVAAATSLLAKSLLRSDDAPAWSAARVRFGMYEGIRQLAVAKAESDPELGLALRSAEARHTAHYLDAGTRWDAWYGGVPDAPRLLLERDNLLAIHARVCAAATPAEDVLRVAIALYPPYAVVGPYQDYAARLDDARDRAIAAASDPALAARFFLVRGRGLQLCARRAEAMEAFEQSLHYARKAHDPAQAARALAYLGSALRAEGRLAEARERLEASMALFDEVVDPGSAAVVLSGLAALDLGEGELDRARERLARVVATQRALGDGTTAAMVQVDEGIVLQELGDLAAARAVFEEALATHRQVGNRRHEGITLGYLAGLDYEQDELARARAGYEAALAITHELGDAKFGAIFGGALAGVLAASGELEAARAVIADAENAAARQGEPRVVGAVALHRARVLGGAAAAEAGRGMAAGLGQQSDDVRFAARMLARAMAHPHHDAVSVDAHAPPQSPQSTQSTQSQPAHALRVAEDGAWFEPPGAARVDITRRAVHRRLLLELVRRRMASPGEATDLNRLVAAGWPGERLATATATNRLHVALASLRQSGLRTVLKRSPEGYALDEAVPILIEHTR